jgi:zinc transporter ZupT
MAAITYCTLPGFVALDPITSAVLGLAVGILIGSMAFKAVQGIVLAVCLGLVAGGMFYHWQIAQNPEKAASSHVETSVPAALPTLPAVLPLDHVTLPPAAQIAVQNNLARWSTIAPSLRQSMLVVGVGTAIMAIVVAWLFPKQTTWVMSAVAGVALLIYGGITLLETYVPGYRRYLPPQLGPRLIILAVLVAIGMLVQRLYFWPGRQQKREQAKDRPGELAAA